MLQEDSKIKNDYCNYLSMLSKFKGIESNVNTSFVSDMIMLAKKTANRGAWPTQLINTTTTRTTESSPRS